MALSAWDKTRVHGTWYSHDGTRLPGTYIVTMPARVTVEQGEAIVPAGVYTQGDLNATGTTDPSLDVMVPSNDDPDVTPLGWQVKVEVNLTMPNGARVKETYVIDTPVGGEVNLRTIPLAQTIPATQTMLLRGVAGGVAALDRDGDVTNAAGVKITGGGGEGGGTTDHRALTNRDAADQHPITAVTGLQSALDDKQPAGDYLTAADLPAPPDLSDVVRDDDPRLSDARPPTTHDHAISQVTGLQSALDGKANTGDIPAAATWDTLSGKPAVIAAGTSQTAARSAIGAGTSNLQLGTGPTTAKPGNWTPSISDVTGLTDALGTKASAEGVQDDLDEKANLANGHHPHAEVAPGSTLTVPYNDGWPTRPTTRTDVHVIWLDLTGATLDANGDLTAPPPDAVTNDVVTAKRPE